MGAFFIGVLVGGTSGVLLMSLVATNRINELQEDLATQIKLRKNRDKFIENQMKTNLRQKNRITDLENNVEFLFNNLSAQKKKLVTNGKSETNF